MEIKKFIDIHVPIFNCNLKCSYCYVSQVPQDNKKTIFNYSPEIVKKALSVERLGGICHFNVCGMGETLIPYELLQYIQVILENGHTVMIVTNGTLTNRFKEYMELSAELKRHLGFKFSYHYLELKRLELYDQFWDNVRLVRDNGCSFSLELTSNDSYEPYIDEIIRTCMKEIGAVCHISVPRDEATDRISLYSKHSKDEYRKIWKVFESPMFELKMRHWEEPRKEFCYAGLWSGLLNLGTGEFNACYRQPGPIGNLFENVNQKFCFYPVGKCEVPHCFNGHSFLAFGTIPEIDEESYKDIRDRITVDGRHWINEDMREQFSKKLKQYNRELSDKEKKDFRKKHRVEKSKFVLKKMIQKISRIKSKVLKNDEKSTG